MSYSKKKLLPPGRQDAKKTRYLRHYQSVNLKWCIFSFILIYGTEQNFTLQQSIKQKIQQG